MKNPVHKMSFPECPVYTMSRVTDIGSNDLGSNDPRSNDIGSNELGLNDIGSNNKRSKTRQSVKRQRIKKKIFFIISGLGKVKTVSGPSAAARTG